MSLEIKTSGVTQTLPGSNEVTDHEEARDGQGDRESRSRAGRFASYARQAVVMLIALAVLLGIIYPLFITGIGQAFFHHKANGSLIVQNGTIVGSALIGQPFTDPGYF